MIANNYILRSGCKLLVITLLIIYSLFFGCTSTNNLNKLNLYKTYNRESQYIDFYYSVYNNSDSLSTVYYSLNSSDFLYTRAFNNKAFTAEYLVKYELYNSENSKIPIDSASFRFVDSLNYNKNVEVINSFPLKIKYKKDYNIVITIIDKNKAQKYSYLVFINKSEGNYRQNFLLRDENGYVVLKNYFSLNVKYFIYSNCEKCKKLYIEIYNNDFPIAKPPHIITNETKTNLKPDSSFILEINNAKSTEINFSKKGIYQIRIDTSQMEGFSFFNFYSSFPEIESPERMLMPLKYITTKTEFNDLEQEKNLKSAIDNFWIEKAGNSDRAKELIRKFYNRVKNANIFFTSYIEGWKTDRGMIYIVFGPPNYIYRSSNVETWIYGEENNILSLTFNFNKLTNPFSDNDYSLVRESGYRDSWYAAIETWRK